MFPAAMVHPSFFVLSLSNSTTGADRRIDLHGFGSSYLAKPQSEAQLNHASWTAIHCHRNDLARLWARGALYGICRRRLSRRDFPPVGGYAAWHHLPAATGHANRQPRRTDIEEPQGCNGRCGDRPLHAKVGSWSLLTHNSRPSTFSGEAAASFASKDGQKFEQVINIVDVWVPANENQ